MTGNATPLWARPAAHLKEQVSRRELRVVDIAASCLGRIAEREPDIHAWAWHSPDQVMGAAMRLDRADAPLALSGVTLGIKDIIDTADMPTAYGAALYRNHRPRRDAEVVRRLRNAGALLIGKTVTTEFAYAHPGPTLNPHNRKHTPGGSSSGSAAAVAAGMVGIAISSQTGGSTIRPAAYCGVVGFKPSLGRIHRGGMKALAPSTDTIGIHARSIADIALLLPVLAGEDIVSAPFKPPSQLRIAYFPGPHAHHAHAEARKALSRARTLLLDGGVRVEPIALAVDEISALDAASRTIMAVEAAASLAEEYARHREMLSAATIRLIETGLGTPTASYHEALVLAVRARQGFDRAMAGFDALMTFSAPGEAPLAGDGTGNSLFNRGWSTLGLPCLSLPFGRGAQFGLPLGIQFVAPFDQDGALLAAARQIARVFNERSPAPRHALTCEA